MTCLLYVYYITCVWITACLMQSICCSSFVFFFFKCHCHLICTSVTPDCASYCVSLLNLWAFQYILFCFLLICFLKSKIFSERVRMICYKFILNGLFLFKTFMVFFLCECLLSKWFDVHRKFQCMHFELENNIQLYIILKQTSDFKILVNYIV